MSLRDDVLRIARAELARGVLEQPCHTGPDVARYLSGCVRDGKPLGLTSGLPWCAAWVSWCVWTAWGQARDENPMPRATRYEAMGEVELWAPDAVGAHGWPPIGYRAAVAELVADARATGTLSLPEDGGDLAFIRPGDLVVFGREGQSPVHGGLGHVAVYEGSAMWGTFQTIGGDEMGPGGYGVRRMLRPTAAEPVVGWVSLARGAR